MERINKYGGVNISYFCLVYVDGEWDFWCVVLFYRIGLLGWESIVFELFIFIEKGVYYWDENGLFFNEIRFGLLFKLVVDV